MNARLLLALLLGLSGCGSAVKAPCAAPAVADYTLAMVKAGCTGEHFDDAKCEPIKAKRDADEKAAGCK